MSAEEMLETLNYILYEENDTNISYRKYPHTKTDDKTYQEIFFNKKSQFIVICEYNHGVLEEKFTTLKELQAINKQIEELGWNK